MKNSELDYEFIKALKDSRRIRNKGLIIENKNNLWKMIKEIIFNWK
jgi:hypothetical protein